MVSSKMTRIKKLTKKLFLRKKNIHFKEDVNKKTPKN